jgi:hypothetical protein
MKSCQHAEKIVAYRLGLLSREEMKEFEAHLKVCTVCQQELAIESAIEKELSMELEPGFIESRVLARVQVRRSQDMRSFWLYALRMAIYGVVAMVVGIFFIPMILEFPIGQYLDISRYTSGLSMLMSVPHTVFLFIAVGYILIFISSLYSLKRMRT